MTPSRWLAFAFVSATFGVAPAAAQDRAPTDADQLTIVFEPCAPPWMTHAELARSLSTELRSAGLQPPRHTQLRLEFEGCNDEVNELVVVWLADGEAPAPVALSLADVEPMARTRTLALALSDQIRDRDSVVVSAPSEEERVDAEPSEPQTPAEVPPIVAAEVSDADSIAGSAEVSADHFSVAASFEFAHAPQASSFFGGGVDITVAPRSLGPLFFRAGFVLNATAESSPFGDITAQTLGAQLTMGLQHDFGAVWVGGGAAIAVRALFAQGTPTVAGVGGDDAAVAVSDLMAVGTGRVVLLGPLHLRADLGVGIVLLGFEADDEDTVIISYTDALLAFRLGLGVDL